MIAKVTDKLSINLPAVGETWVPDVPPADSEPLHLLITACTGDNVSYVPQIAHDILLGTTQTFTVPVVGFIQACHQLQERPATRLTIAQEEYRHDRGRGDYADEDPRSDQRED